MRVESLSSKHLQEVLRETLQIVVFDRQGIILESNNTFVNLTDQYGKSVFDFDPLLQSLREVLDNLTSQNHTIKFPRMEMPFGSRDGVFDHKVQLHRSEEGIEYFVWIVVDSTNSSQYLALVQQERNDAAIALELERLKTENEHLNEIVEARTAEIRQQAELIHLKNLSITQSIQYAARIQSAFQPSDLDLDLSYFDYFVMNVPRDVVSGDFFWAFHDDTYQIMAAVDCTGHGVPGAFLALVGYMLFDQIVKTDGERMPSVILTKINQKLFNLLSHNTKEAFISEGMDVALVCIEKQNNRAFFSGAKRPFLLYRENEVIEIKGSSSTIGGKFIRERHFEDKIIELKKEDKFYMFSDGFADQFGGEEEKRLGSRNFKRILRSIQDLPFHSQKQAFEQAFESWKAYHKQIDDVTVLGVQIKS